MKSLQIKAPRFNELPDFMAEILKIPHHSAPRDLDPHPQPPRVAEVTALSGWWKWDSPVLPPVPSAVG